jgi:diaminopimelate epimerase
VITKAILCIPPKASTSGAKNDYTLKNQAGKTFVSQKVGLLRDGFKTISEDNLLYICDSEAKRTITLSAGSGVDQAVGNGALCIIEYLA